MANRPKLSICIPTYNRSDKVKKCVLSVLEAESSEIEVIVSDNGSEDRTWELLNEINDSRLRLVRNDRNIGFTLNLLKVIEEANSKFVFLMSDDDICAHEYLDVVLNQRVLETPELGLVYGSIYSREKSAYYYKYDDALYDGAKAFEKCALRHSYMSSMLLCKEDVDFDKLHRYADSEESFLYPHEVMVLMILKAGRKAVLRSDIACYQGRVGKSYIINESVYYQYKQRLELIEQYGRIVSEMGITGNERTAVSKQLAEIAIHTYEREYPWEDLDRYKKEKEKVKYLLEVLRIEEVGKMFYLGVAKKRAKRAIAPLKKIVKKYLTGNL